MRASTYVKAAEYEQSVKQNATCDPAIEGACVRRGPAMGTSYYNGKFYPFEVRVGKGSRKESPDSVKSDAQTVCDVYVDFPKEVFRFTTEGTAPDGTKRLRESVVHVKSYANAVKKELDSKYHKVLSPNARWKVHCDFGRFAGATSEVLGAGALADAQRALGEYVKMGYTKTFKASMEELENEEEEDDSMY